MHKAEVAFEIRHRTIQFGHQAGQQLVFVDHQGDPPVEHHFQHVMRFGNQVQIAEALAFKELLRISVARHADHCRAPGVVQAVDM